MGEFLDDGRIEFRPARRDAQIRADILSCLARAPWLDTRGLAVHVERGDVLLDGIQIVAGGVAVVTRSFSTIRERLPRCSTCPILSTC